MIKQTFCENNLYPLISGKDKLKTDIEKKLIIAESIDFLNNKINDGNLLRKITLHNKEIFITQKPQAKIILKKLSKNISIAARIKPQRRNFITSNIKNLLRESTPFKVYRLDISQFFESFSKEQIIEGIDSLKNLLPINNNICEAILLNHSNLSGKGVPRGLSISTPISELLMKRFDLSMRSHPDVFYYARYVDDIIIITSSREDCSEILSFVEKQLPVGLSLNRKKYDEADGSKHYKKTPIPPAEEFEYLGYTFKFNQVNTPDKGDPRKIEVSISQAKISKIKKRICRSFISFHKKNDFQLLLDRIKFLTNNFSIYDIESCRKKNVGIYFNYPLITESSQSLNELDIFLKSAIYSSHGKIFSKTAPLLDSKKKRILLGQSFYNGHTNRKYISFSGKRISEIKSCWVY